MTARARGALLGWLLLSALSAPGGAATCSPTIFIEAVAYPAGAPARAVVVADFNGDTNPDVAAAATSPRSVSILLNDGSGGLESPLLVSLPEDPVAIAAADLRSNGTTDLAVATYSGVFILLGHGDGTFDSPVLYPSDTFNISSIAVGQFDANSSPDIVLGSYYSSNEISLLPGLGDGTFGEPVLTASSPPVVSMTSGDYDGDGSLDLVVSSGNSGFLFVYPGFGDGTFGAPSAFIAGSALYGVTTGDFDADGNLDLAVGSGDSASVLLGNGSGGFEAALLYAAGITAGSLAVADLDQDGILDIVVGESSLFFEGGNEVSVLHGRGDGTFDPGAPYLSGGASGIATGDLNGDSLPDVVTAGGSVFVLLGTPDGSLLAVPNSRLNGPTNPNFARGDWNGDGRLDFAWVAGNQVLVVEGAEGGRFRPTGTLDFGSLSVQPYGVTAGRFVSSSETADIVVSTYGDVLLFRGNGDGTFEAPVPILTNFGLGAIDVGDFDGSGGQDIVVNQGCCGSGSILTLLGNGDGTFQDPVPTPLPEEVYDFVPANLHVDSPPPGGNVPEDLVVVTQNNVRVLLAQGHDGNFQIGATFPTFNTSAVAVGNFDGGANDLLISTGVASVSLYPNTGDGTFEPPVTIALATSGGSVTTGDYDDDSFADFGVVSGSQVLVFLGLGDGHFLSPLVLTTQISAGYLETGDFAGDGADDLAAMGQEGIAAFRNSRLGASAQGATVLVGQPAVLEARASGYGALTYQWRKDGAPLSDGGSISGAQTAVLTIDPAAFSDAGGYDVVVTDACTNVTSNSAELAVEFADVPLSSPFHEDIIAIATAGITGGCGGADYCPASPVRRDQMAAFLLRSEHGSAYVPPACAGLFSDVPCPGPFTDWVEQLAAEGVTGGCGTGIYCPDQSVTRAQMAVFLIKTSEGSAYVPPPATGIFGDVPVGSFAADFIEDLYTRGITGGCSASPLLYCPGSTVLRQQMASFLARTFLTP
jgi:hypothetical protein